MTSILVGTVLAIGALAIVLYPLFRAPASGGGAAAVPVPSGTVAGPESQSAIDTLREIEFDRATGKLSDDDYASLHARYTSAAVSEMRSSDAAEARASGSAGDTSSIDEAEALIRRFSAQAASCSSCGPRLEPDAIYCSNCGRFLPGACSRCGAIASEPSAQYCTSCGAKLAA